MWRRTIDRSPFFFLGTLPSRIFRVGISRLNLLFQMSYRSSVFLDHFEIAGNLLLVRFDFPKIFLYELAVMFRCSFQIAFSKGYGVFLRLYLRHKL